MGGHVLWIAFALAVQFSTVLGRNHFYEYYYSRYHHKDHSSTTAIPSHALDHSSTTALSSQESDTSSEEVIASVSAEYYTTVEPAVVQSGGTYSDQSTSWFIAGFVLIAAVVSSLIVCCCCLCCRCRRENKGLVVGNNEPITTEADPQQPILFGSPLPPNYMEEPFQQFPAYYQAQPEHQLPFVSEVERMYQRNPNNPTQSSYIPDSPPPPYDAPSY